MAKYRKVDPRIWDDEKFKSMSHDGQLLFFCFLTHPHMTSIGAMRATIPGLAAEIGWDLKAFRESFRESYSKRMIEQDEKAPLIALPNFLKYNRPENPNVLKAWGGAFSHLPDCRLKSLLYQRLKAFAEGLGKAYQKAFEDSFPIPCPHDIRKPEQEQEQEPEQEKEPQPAPSEPPAHTVHNTEALALLERPAFRGTDPKALVDTLLREKIPTDRWDGVLSVVEDSLVSRRAPPVGAKNNPTGYALKIIRSKGAEIRDALAEADAAQRDMNTKRFPGADFNPQERAELIEKYHKLFPGITVVFDDTQPFEPDPEPNPDSKGGSWPWKPPGPQPGPEPGPDGDAGTSAPTDAEETEKEDANAQS